MLSRFALVAIVSILISHTSSSIDVDAPPYRTKVSQRTLIYTRGIGGRHNSYSREDSSDSSSSSSASSDEPNGRVPALPVRPVPQDAERPSLPPSPRTDPVKEVMTGAPSVHRPGIIPESTELDLDSTEGRNDNPNPSVGTVDEQDIGFPPL